MTWNAHQTRGGILRHVSAVADARRDGELPLDVDGVRQAFADELDLLGALQLRWHTRLAGQIDRSLMSQRSWRAPSRSSSSAKACRTPSRRASATADTWRRISPRV